MQYSDHTQAYIHRQATIASSKRNLVAYYRRTKAYDYKPSPPLVPLAPTPPSPTLSTHSASSSKSSCSSAFSSHTSETASTDLGEEVKGAKTNEVASGPIYKPATDTSEDKDEDQGVVFIKSKKVGRPWPTFATSIPAPNPYAAFMRQAGYKGLYIFPSIRS
ncbi:hypothetical protein FRB90_007130 [Tulasnella sp. 427]|nr:hypothetical protein FRB90_007130 [Tulasnella sp. 427]